MGMKVCSAVTIEENGATKEVAAKPEQSSQMVPSLHEFITNNAREDLKDMNDVCNATKTDICPYVSHNFCPTLMFP